jgi:hypothetical protein
MRHVRTIVAMAGSLATACLVSACSHGGLNSDNFKDQINAILAKHGSTCFNLQNHNVNWDAGFQYNAGINDLATPDVGEYADQNELILADMVRAGMIQAVAIRNPFVMGRLYGLRAAAGVAKYWGKDGFCVGRPRVVEVQKWTTPADLGGAASTQISYTWRLTDVPGWARNPAFANIQGMAKPADEEAEAIQTNKGWEVQDQELRE